MICDQFISFTALKRIAVVVYNPRRLIRTIIALNEQVARPLAYTKILLDCQWFNLDSLYSNRFGGIEAA